MLRLVGRIPHRTTVACSGGVDSIAMLHFVVQGRRDVEALHIRHGNSEYHQEAESCVHEYCKNHGVPLRVVVLDEVTGPNKELLWREARVEIFREQEGERKLLTGHNLDDFIEWYFFTAARNGVPRYMPYYGYSVKPFLACSKKQLIRYAKKHKLRWVEDPTNYDGSNARSRMRAGLVPELLRINPGIHKTFRKKVLEQQHYRANRREDWV